MLNFRHLEFFEMVRVNDEKELAKRYDQVHIDTKSSQVKQIFFSQIYYNFVLTKHNHCIENTSNTSFFQALFETLRSKLNHTAAFPHFMSLLQHCILLPCKYRKNDIFCIIVILKLYYNIYSTRQLSIMFRNNI